MTEKPTNQPNSQNPTGWQKEEKQNTKERQMQDGNVGGSDGGKGVSYTLIILFK